MRLHRTFIIVIFMFGTLVACAENDNKPSTEHGVTEHPPEIINDEEQEKQKEEEQAEEDDEEMDLNEDEIETQYEVTDHWSIVPSDEEINEKIVLITVDDAPEHYAVDMAHTLKDLDAPAIFFVNGHFLESEEDKQKLKDIYDMGFAIGNHTYSHANLPELSEDEQREEIIRVNEIVEEITGEPPLFFRAPYGANSEYASELVKELGMTLMNWTYGYDWEPEYQTKEAITDIMVNAKELDHGANLLMHDRKWTAEALNDIVLGLRQKGYDMVDPHLIKRPNED